MSRLMLCRLVVGRKCGQLSCWPLASSQQTAANIHYATISKYPSDKQVFGGSSNQTAVMMGSVRQIYSETSLRMDSLDSLRQDKGRIFDSGKERYIERVRSYIERGEMQSVVKEDLINIIGLAETEQHLDLIEELILTPGLRDVLKDGPWGSVLMRLYYRMEQPDRALKNIKDTDRFGEFFMQYAAFRVIMTQLYRAGRYNDVLDLYNLTMDKLNLKNFTRQRQIDVLAVAACVKLNTPESFNVAETIYSKSTSVDHRHLRSRLDSLFVYMAINMNEPAKALNHLTGSRVRTNFHLPTISLKTIALINLNRFEDVVYHLREAIQTVSNQQKAMTQEIADMIGEKKNEIEDDKIREEIQDILVEMKDNNLLDDRTLESIIFNEIETREGQFTPEQQQMGGDRGGYGDRRFQSSSTRPRRDRPYSDRSSSDRPYSSDRSFSDRPYSSDRSNSNRSFSDRSSSGRSSFSEDRQDTRDRTYPSRNRFERTLNFREDQ